MDKEIEDRFIFMEKVIEDQLVRQDKKITELRANLAILTGEVKEIKSRLLS